MHHPVSVFNPFNDVMQVTQAGSISAAWLRACNTACAYLDLFGSRSAPEVSTNDTFIQLLAPGEFRPVGQKRTPAGSSRILPERAGAVAWRSGHDAWSWHQTWPKKCEVFPSGPRRMRSGNQSPLFSQILSQNTVVIFCFKCATGVPFLGHRVVLLSTLELLVTVRFVVKTLGSQGFIPGMCLHHIVAKGGSGFRISRLAWFAHVRSMFSSLCGPRGFCQELLPLSWYPPIAFFDLRVSSLLTVGKTGGETIYRYL